MMSNEARRAAVYFGGGALLVAWLAAANSATRQAAAPTDVSVAPHATPSAEINLREEAARLKARLTSAPTPTPNPRNPFRFAAAPRVAAARVAQAATLTDAETAPVPPAPMALTLMGIAEKTGAKGIERTAIVGGPNDAIFMVTEGQAIGDRYQVTAIGADALELKDLATGGFRRLALR